MLQIGRGLLPGIKGVAEAVFLDICLISTVRFRRLTRFSPDICLAVGVMVLSLRPRRCSGRLWLSVRSQCSILRSKVCRLRIVLFTRIVSLLIGCTFFLIMAFVIKLCCIGVMAFDGWLLI